SIDATGQVENADTSVAFAFDGADDLSQKLAARPEVSDCVSGLTAAYAFAGAGGRTCLAEDARAAFARGDVGVLDYFAQLAGAPGFAERAQAGPATGEPPSASPQTALWRARPAVVEGGRCLRSQSFCRPTMPRRRSGWRCAVSRVRRRSIGSAWLSMMDRAM